MADRTALQTYSGTRSARSSERRTSTALRRFFTAMLLSKEIWLVYIASFLCGRASLGTGIYPFGIALFWTVVRSGRRTHAIAALIGILLGFGSVAPLYRLLAVAAVLVGCLFVDSEIKAGERYESGLLVWGQALAIAAAHVGTRALFARAFLVGTGSPLWIAIEAVLITTTIVVWRPLAILWGTSFRGPVSREGWISIALFAVMLSLGLIGLHTESIYPAELWNRMITLVAALIGGISTGAAVGTALAWLTGITGLTPLGGAGVYALSGLLAGLFAARGKLGVGLGFLLGHLLVSVQTSNPQEIVYSLIHALVALAFLSLLPNRWLRSLERALPGSRARERFTLVREDRLRAAVSERLVKMSELLAEMGRSFAVVSASRSDDEEQEPDVAMVVQKINERLCVKCPGYRKCWEDHLYQTYKEMVEFVRAGEIKGEVHGTDIPLPLRQRCIRTGQLTQTAHGALSEMQERLRWYRRLEAQNNVVPAQLQGVAALLEGLATQVRVETDGSDEVQVMLADALREARLAVSTVEVRPLGSARRFDILIERSTPSDRMELWKDEVSKVVTDTLQREYIIWQERSHADGRCTLRFAERPPYGITHASAVISKESDTVSGDTFTTVDLIDGRVAIILSDGMGNGPQAALQSESAAQLLGTLLETGFDLRSAVRSVNSLLLMRTPEESFATIDAVVIDRFTGVAEFLKVGAAPTFIIRESDVSVIRSSTLPVGIVQQIDARVQRRYLQPGDTIVLVTDGLLDSISRGPEQEEWLASLLEREGAGAPDDILQAVMARVSEATGGVWTDDVTIATIRFCKSGSEEAPDATLKSGTRRVG